jgi:hypothetical protein
MPPEPALQGIAKVIQMSLAPVFVLTMVATMLTVLTNRLGRIIDRARTLESDLDQLESGVTAAHGTLATLHTRARLVDLAITLCVTAALLVCLLIVLLFAGAMLEVNTSREVAWAFILAMLGLSGALLAFLREVLIATKTLRIG